jgi:hypothetical protein
VESGVNTGVPVILGSDGKPIRSQNSKGKKKTRKPIAEKNKTDNTSEEEKRVHKKYKTSINLSALKELEGTTASSFLDLARAVILIDNKPYNEDYIALSQERKNDFRRLIEHYAVMDTIGKRKYHIKRVYSVKQREELNEQQANIQRDNSKK